MEPKDVPYLLLGAMSTIREETKKTVDDLVEKGKTGGGGKGAKGIVHADRAVRDLVEKGRKEREDLLNAIGKEVTRILDNMGAITKNDIRALDKRLANIEKRIK